MHRLSGAAIALVALAGCTSSSPSNGETGETNPPGASPFADISIVATGFVGPEPTLGVSKAGHVFVAAGDDVLRSTDGGLTWRSVHRYEREGAKAGARLRDRRRPGDEIGLAFLGTRDHDGPPRSAGNSTKWHLFVGRGPLSAALTGQGFVVRQATPESDPVRVGPICLPNQPCPKDARNLLEFIDRSYAPDGSYWVVYADGCNSILCRSASPPDPALSRDRQAIVARWIRAGVPSD